MDAGAGRPEAGAARRGCVVSIDPNGPLPELQFKWRRWFTFILAIGLLLIVDRHAVRLTDAEALRQILSESLRLIALLAFLYLVAPTAETIVKMLAQIAAIRRG